ALVEPGDPIGVRNGPSGLDLHAPYDALIDRARDLGMPERAHPAATCPQRDAALSRWWIPEIRDGRSYLIDRLELRQHDPLGAEVERPPDPEPLGGLRADEGGHRCRAGCVEQCQQLALGSSPVLEVEDRPVEPGP